MLSELRIRSLGVIEDALLSFAPGLNVLTGETGAGKTMIVHGLGLLFGARADAALVRDPAPGASVEGILELADGHRAAIRALEAGAEIDEHLILLRTLSAQGRSRAFAGGRSVPVKVLSELAEDLVVVHGQADQWRLRSPDEHRTLLDAFGAEAIAEPLRAYTETYDAWLALRAERDRLTALAGRRSADLDAFRAGVDRIEAVAPQPGEDHALRAEDELLGHADQLRTGAGAAAEALLGDDVSAAENASATAAVAAATRVLSGLGEHDPRVAAFETRLEEIGVLLSELGGDLSSYAAGIELDEGRLAAVQQRRSELASLTRFFGGDIDAVLDWLAQASARLHEVDTAADTLEAIETQVGQVEEKLGELAGRLSAVRAEAAAELGAAVTDELAHLAMGSASVQIALTRTLDPAGILLGGTDDRVHLTRHGADTVEFLLQANTGMPPRPVARAASGGELSRVMLAIEVVLGQRVTAVPTYVFDEVDAGVGGRAALDVGARLARLATHAQVIVVTHLPQVAAFADRHLVVTKADDGHVSRSDVTVLDDGARRKEVARMMAGSQSSTALAHARELLEDARATRSSWDH